MLINFKSETEIAASRYAGYKDIELIYESSKW